MWGRAVTVVLLAVAAVILIAGGSIAVSNQVNFGTFYTTSPPPRIQYCDRRYYLAEPPRTDSLGHVTAFLAANGLSGLTQVGSTPSGLPILANVMPPETRASYHTDVCTMGVWVQTGPDSYVLYSLSGGP